METRGQTLLNTAPAPAGIARAILIAHLLLSPLLFSGETVEAFEFPKAALLTLTILAAGTLVLWEWLRPRADASSGERLRSLVPTWRDPLAVGVVLFLFSASISTIGSIAPRLSLWGAPESHAGLITMLGYGALFFLTRHLCRGREDAWRFLAAAVVGAITASAYAMVQAVRADPIPWDSISQLYYFIRPFGTLAHPNFLAAYLAMTLPLLLLFADRAIQTRHWPVLAVLLLGTAGAAAAIAAACSRGAWLASACGLAACGLGWLALGRGRRIVLCGLVIVPAMFAVLWMVTKFVPQHLDPFRALSMRLQRFAFAGARKEIWSIALDLFRDHPLIGTGLDTFHLMFGQKRTVTSWTAEGNMTPLRAHNEVLQVLATQGVVGLMALLVMLGGLVTASLRAWRHATRDDRLLTLSLVAGVIAFAVQDCLSFTVIGQGTLFVTFAALLSRRSQACAEDADAARGFAVALLGGAGLFTLLLWRNIDAASARAVPGWAWGTLTILASLGISCAAVLRLLSPNTGFLGWHALRYSEGRGRQSISRPSEYLRACHPRCSEAASLGTWIARAILGGAALTLVQVLVLEPLQADLACRRADRLLPSDIPAAMHAYEEAATRVPDDPFYWAKLGDAARRAAGHGSDGTLRRQIAEVGRSAFAHAAELMPMNASYHVGLGRMNMELTRLGLAAPRQALAEYDVALRLDGNNGVYYADAANAALVMEQLAAARAYARQGLERYPWYGPLSAQSGYVAMLEHHPEEAVRHLTEALAGDWFGDDAARVFAESMLARAQQQAGP